MAATRLAARPLKVGDVLRVRYRDHSFFKDADASRQRPRVLEAFGRLDYQDEDYVRVVFEQYSEPASSRDSKLRSMGLVILRSTILELRRAES
jgi:hypothetical protein